MTNNSILISGYLPVIVVMYNDHKPKKVAYFNSYVLANLAMYEWIGEK